MIPPISKSTISKFIPKVRKPYQPPKITIQTYEGKLSFMLSDAGTPTKFNTRTITNVPEQNNKARH